MTVTQCKIEIRALGFSLKVDNDWQVLKLKGRNSKGIFEIEIDWPDYRQGKQDALEEAIATAQSLAYSRLIAKRFK